MKKKKKKNNIYLHNMLEDRHFVWLLLFAQCHMCHGHMVHKSPTSYQLLAPAQKTENKQTNKKPYKKSISSEQKLNTFLKRRQETGPMAEK